VQSAKKRALDESVSTTPLIYGLDPQGLNKAFPFHFIFNQKLEILQCGKVRLIPPHTTWSTIHIFNIYKFN
jgi:hypothetical protein